MNLVKITVNILSLDKILSKEDETKLRLSLAGAYKETLGMKDFLGDVEIVGIGEEPTSKLEPVVPTEPTEKFNLLVDLGIITVPGEYVHVSRLTTFRNQNREKFYYYNENITDKNFPNPSRVLKPGDKLRVRVFKQVIGGTTTSEERMAFLATKKAIHTGAQGASLVFEQKRDQLPKGKWCASFDEMDRLWYADGHHRVPHVLAHSDGDFNFNLGNFGSDRADDVVFLCLNLDT